MVKSNNYQRLLVVTAGLDGEEIFMHAGAFLRRELRNYVKPEVVYYDSNQNSLMSTGSLVLGQRTVDFTEIFQQYKRVKMYVLCGRQLPCNNMDEAVEIAKKHAKIAKFMYM